MIHRRHLIGAAVDEEQRAWLERAEHSLRAAVGQLGSVSQAQHQAGQPDEGCARQLDRMPHVFGDECAQVAEGAVQHQRLDPGFARGAQERHNGAHRIAEEADPGVRNPLARESDDRLQLEHLVDAEGDRRAVAAGHAAVRIEDHVEAFSPQGRGDAQRVGALALVPSRDDDRLRRARLPEVPGPKADAVRCDQLDLFRIRLKLEWREREVVEKRGPCRHECAPVDGIGNQDVGNE